MSSDPTIIYTLTDEAPLLATHAFLPVVSTFTKPAGIKVEQADISVAARILAQFPENLTPEQRVPDVLTELGKKTPSRNCRPRATICPTTRPIRRPTKKRPSRPNTASASARR